MSIFSQRLVYLTKNIHQYTGKYENYDNQKNANYIDYFADFW